MKRTTALLLLIMGALHAGNTAVAQDTESKVRLRFDTRFDYTFKAANHTGGKNKSSFDGRYLNILVDGTINDHFSYNYRQRMILDGKLNYESFFNATDWMYLTYHINRNWYLSAGKQVIAIGGFEYDAAPIDVYYASDFWNHITCYQLGVSGGFKSNNERHHLAFQISNSPFATRTLESLYAYNLIWYGDFDILKTIYSVNRIEYAPKRYINYLALGNRFNIGNFSLELDLTGRVADKQRKLLADYTVTGNAIYNFNNRVHAFAKAGYDENSAQAADDPEPFDRVVRPGTKRLFYSAGAEFFPIRNSSDVRIHGYVGSDNVDPQFITFNLGVRWRMNIFQR